MARAADAVPDLSTIAPAPSRSWRWIGAITVALALASAGITFAILANLTPIAPVQQVVVTVLSINAVAAVLLLAVIGREIWTIFQARRQGRAGARLHVHIIGWFSVVAALPAILVAVIASVMLNRGIDTLSSERTRSLLEGTIAATQLYLTQQNELLQGEIAFMAVDVSRAKPMFDSDRERFRQFLNFQAQNRGLRFAMLVRGDRTELEKVE